MPFANYFDPSISRGEPLFTGVTKGRVVLSPSHWPPSSGNRINGISRTMQLVMGKCQKKKNPNHKTNKNRPRVGNSKQPTQELLLPVLTIHYRGADSDINETAVIPSTEPTDMKGNNMYNVDCCVRYKINNINNNMNKTVKSEVVLRKVK
jgi:hypothetical protein